MTTYYVGPGGSDGNNGTTWALRKLTLNGAEDIPVTSGDVVYVGPGIYREMLTCDVDGTSEIAYIADVTGIHTDGVGGDVIISGSNADTTATRNRCIIADSKSYRTFIGFHFVGYNENCLYFLSCDHLVLRDCCVGPGDMTTTRGLYLYSTYDTVEVTRCLFFGCQTSLEVSHTEDQSATAFVISDCLFIGAQKAFITADVDSIVIQNCSFVGNYISVQVDSLAAATSITVRNCVIHANYRAFQADAAGKIASTYCLVTSPYNSNWTAGTGDVQSYVPNLQLPLLYGTYCGIRYPVPLLGELNPYAYAAHRTGSSETSTDLFGITKPATAAISSWGAIQFQDKLRETGTTRGSSTASIKLATAGEHQLWVPVTATSTTIGVYVYRGADYAGTNPRMIIKEPGQSDRTTTDTGSASQWNLLTDTFTPAGEADYVVVCLQSLNTATSGSYAVFFDDLAVS